MSTLRELRIKRLMSHKELATAAGVTVGTITTIENGHTLPRLATARKLALALGVEPGEIDEVRATWERAMQRAAKTERP